MAILKGFKSTTTKLGQIITKPASMGTNRGTISPCIVKGADVAGWPDNIWHSLLYCSTEHDALDNPTTGGNGGIWLFCCNGDPTVAANWYDWDDIKNNAEFAYLTARPSNPIFVDTVAGKQTETPHLKIINGTIYLYYHNEFNNIYRSYEVQNTAYATGTDGINFTRQAINLTYNPQTKPGCGHTGYFTAGENPFPHIPYTYIAHTLHGGAGSFGEFASEWCYWGSNDYINWSPISRYAPTIGRLRGSIPDIDADVYYQYIPAGIVNAVRDGPYWRITGSATIVNTYGIYPKSSKRIELLVDDDFQIVSEPEIITDVGGSGSIDEESVGGNAEIHYNGVTYVVYVATDINEIKSLAIAQRGLAECNWSLLNPINSDKTVLFDENFKELTSGASVPATISASNGTASIPNDGMLAVQANIGQQGFIQHNTGVTISSHAVVDFTVEGFWTKNITNVSRFLAISTDASDTSASRQTVYFWSSDNTSHAPMKLVLYIGGVEVRSLITSKYIGWQDSWWNGERESPQARQNLTLRFIPSLSIAILMIGNAEVDVFDLTSFDFNKEMFMRVYCKNNSNTNDEYVGVQRLTAKGGVDAIPAVSGAPVMTATAGDGQIDFSCPAVSGATGYKAFAILNTQVIEVDLGATPSGSIAGLDNGTEYVTYMRSYNSVGESEPTVTQAVTPAATSATLNMAITGLPDANYTVDFTNPSTGELVARQAGIAFVSGSATSNTIAIAAGTTLEYTIRTGTHIAGDSGVTA